MNAQKAVPCVQVLNEIEQQFGAVFNYETNSLQNLKCLELDSNEDLDESILKVKEFSGLTFNQLAENRYVVKLKDQYALEVLNEEGNPVKNAEVVGHRYTSNQYGKLFIPKEKINLKNIQIQHPDYETKTVELTHNKIKVVLLSYFIEFEEVTLTPLFTTGIYKREDHNFLLKPQEVNLLAGTTHQDIVKTIQQLPNVFSLDESVSNLSIKGGTNDQNLVLWNGMRLYQNSHFFGLISAFNENLIEEINVYDNATPAQFGNSVSGTVEIKSNSNLIKKPSYGIGVNFLSADAFLAQPIGNNMDISFTARRSFTDFWNSPTYESYEEKSFQDSFITLNENSASNDEIVRDNSFYFQDAELHYKWQISPKLKINTHGILFQNDLKYSEDNLTTQQIRDSDLKQFNIAFGGEVQYNLNENNNLSISSSYSNHNSDGRNFTFNTNQESIQNNEVQDYRTGLSWKLNLSKKSSLFNGVDYNGLRVINSFSNNISGFRFFQLDINNTYSLYNEYNFNNEKINFRIGNRSVYYTKTEDFILEPRINFGYNFNEQLTLSLRAERKSQNIVQIIDLENNFLGIEKRRWFLSNNDIYPVQTANQLEIGATYKKSVVQLSLNGFIKEVEDITTNSQGFRNQGQFGVHFGNSVTKGILAHANFKWKRLNFWTSYSYLKDDYTFPDLVPQEFRGNNDVRNRVILGSNYKIKSFIISLGAEYHSGTPFTNINFAEPIIPGIINQINYESPNQSQLPEYFRVDASVQYQVQFKNKLKLELVLGVINLFNRTNLLNRDFRLNQVSDDVVQILETEGLGFNPNLGVKIFY